MRGATCNRSDKHKDNKFQSTRPMRGATMVSDATVYHVRLFQSTRPMRGATRYEEP